MGLSLYEISSELEAVIEGGFVVNEDTGEILFDESNLDELQKEFTDKMEAVGCVIKNKEAEAAAIKEEKKRLDARLRVLENEAERLKVYALNNLERVGEKKVETAKVRLSTRKSTFVNITDESRIPREFIKEKVTISFDKTAISKALKAGEEVYGAELSERSSLQIK